MSHVEITLKSGITIHADVSEWIKTKNRVSGDLTGFEWEHSGPRRLNHVRIEEVAAVVFVDDKRKKS